VGVDDAAGLSCTVNACDSPPPLAVRATVCVVLTAAAVAVKPTLVALAGTVTDGGTERSALLLASATVKPPEEAAELIVTEQESVPAPVMEVLAQERELTLIVGCVGVEVVAGLSCTVNAWVAPPPLAVRITVCVVVTAAAVALKLALVAPAGTVTEEGTVRAALLLPIPTLYPPLGAAELMVTEQESVPVPLMEVLPHTSALTMGAVALDLMPLPCSLTVALGTDIELVLMVRSPELSELALGP
jgi:hypothetical protein